jgi:predicted CopG family antitoxin
MVLEYNEVSGGIKTNFTTITIKRETYNKLLKVKAEMQMEKAISVSFTDVIEELIQLYYKYKSSFSSPDLPGVPDRRERRMNMSSAPSTGTPTPAKSPNPPGAEVGEGECESRTVFTSSHYAIEVECEGDKVTLRRIYWPLVNAGNYQKDEVILTPNNVSVHEHWDGWARYGQLTGGCKSADVDIEADEYIKLKDAILNVKNVSDFNKLVELVSELENKREEEINEAIDDFINELQNLDFIQEKLEMIKDPERRKEFIEKLRDDIDEYFNPEP